MSAILPLHHGRAPKWLFKRMVGLSECIVKIIVQEKGVRGLLDRLSDPWFFQSLSCILGYDWHSSGTTTVTCGVLKESIIPTELGIAVAGGKGKASKKAPRQIEQLAIEFGLNDRHIKELKHASKMSAKVDNCLVQDGYHLYHHTFIFDEGGKWIVIQQGINEEFKNARRYHWSPDQNDLIDEPHNAIVCMNRLNRVLDLTASKSRDNRQSCVDIVNENPRRLRNFISKSKSPKQSTLHDWTGSASRLLVMPSKVNWKALREAYEFQPKKYEDLISLKGIGPSTVRGLSLVAELIYGEEPSWCDPVRFSFAFGGKDGVPFPVDKHAMDEAIDVLKCGISSATIKREEKLRALKRLRKCVPSIHCERLAVHELR